MTQAGEKALSREALDFAPGLLSIQESPPAKLPRAVLHSVAGLFAILLAWAVLGRLEVVAAAEGRLVPLTYLKIVQPAEGGIVEEILVREGDAVEAGQVLMHMNAELVQADARAIQNALALKRLQLRRIDAELAGMAVGAVATDPPDLYAQIAAQYRAHRQAYLDSMAHESAILDKARHDLRAAQEVLRKLEQTVPGYRRSADAFERLGASGFFSPLAVEERQREWVEKERDMKAQEATVVSLQATIAASERRMAQIASTYRSELQNERVATDSEYRRLSEERQKIEHKANLLSLRAPQRGIVKDLATHTPGTVVSPGTVLMSLVPQDEPLQAEILVKNQDVGFVYGGQAVKLKLSAYPFQKYGMIDGTVIHVGPDAAEGRNSPPVSGERAAMPAAPGYKALVRLHTQYLESDGTRLRLSPGMQVVADIQLGTRSVMEYLLSPVQKAWQEAGRER